MSERFWPCPDCGDVQLFARLHPAAECPDAPGESCPEWCCAVCGAALLAGFPLRDAEPAPALMLELPGKVA